MPQLEIHGYAPSTFVRTVRIVCEEKGVAYGLGPVELRAESHRQLHPYLKMPVLRHGSLTFRVDGDRDLFAATDIGDDRFESFPHLREWKERLSRRPSVIDTETRQ